MFGINVRLIIHFNSDAALKKKTRRTWHRATDQNARLGRYILPSRMEFDAAWESALTPLNLVECADGDIEGLTWRLEDWWGYVASYPALLGSITRVPCPVVSVVTHNHNFFLTAYSAIDY